jgi:hypothetical protein
MNVNEASIHIRDRLLNDKKIFSNLCWKQIGRIPERERDNSKRERKKIKA